MSTTDVRPTGALPAAATRLPALAVELAARRDLWPPVRYDPQRRWYARIPVEGCVDSGSGFSAEAWLLSWLPGQRTGLHDHGEAAGTFVVVQGLLTELSIAPRPDRGVREVARTFGAGAVRPFGSWHVHDMVNESDAPALSVHVYSPALTAMRRYRRYRDVLVQVGLQLAGEDW